MNRYHKEKIIDGIVSLTNNRRLLNLYSIIKNKIRPYVIILVYHRIGTLKDDWSVHTIHTKDFEMQMRYLKKTHEIIALEDIANLIKEKKPLPRRGVIITFDDGYKDNYLNTFPILKKYKIPATIFLTTGHIDTNKPYWWDTVGYIIYNSNLKNLDLGDFGNISIYPKKNISKSFYEIMEKFKIITEEKKHDIINKIINNSDVKIPNNLGRDLIMSWDEVKEMNENGISFGAHTINHPILTKISLKQAKYEIIQSKKDIEKRINTPVTTFCYPNGFQTDFNDDIKNLVKDNGFICASTLIPRAINHKTDLFELGRIPPGWNSNSFEFCMSGLYTDILKFSPL